jgi:hypothetical protein
MRRYRLSSDAKYDLKVHLVWCPKYRKQEGEACRMTVDLKSTPLEPLALQARVVQLALELAAAVGGR